MMIEILKTFVYAAGVLLIYALSLVIYRLYLHPLARFPGPKLAAATKWYEFYFDILKAPGGQFAWELERMHDVYDLLTQKLKRTLKDGGIVNIRREYLAYTTDTICDYVFSETQGLLHDDKKAGEWLKTLDSIILAIPIVKQFPWLNPLIMRLPLRPLQVLVPDAARLLKLDRDLHHQADTFLRTRPDMTSEKDSSSAEDVIKHKTLFESIMTSKVLPPHEKSTERLAQEGVVVLTAASETTARVLSIATFHMLANKERVLDRLQKELGEVMSEPDSQVDLKILEQLPWLVGLQLFLGEIRR
ncbi:uncharacterized protein KY384_000837 [Bacidia gigantensis]|uniref:uncharacterized protein n=1 Tax=Bacidia gigantensis TaxID=2732470 RepID=UPI001D0515CD|nr:uncharacterized protein KY384_000837 [Bacidia gigantensis]KAG8533995.1 hypothetical protein KY384_000837 [Bacidia gigantensis]